MHLLALCLSAALLTNPETTAPRDSVYQVVEKQASFPGGTDALYRFLSRNMKYPDQATRARVQGKVFVRFTVETDGSITSPEVTKGLGFGCDQEALRVVKAFPHWTPARDKGKAVRSRMNLPLSFVLVK